MNIKEAQKRLKKHDKHLSFDEPSHRYFFDDGKQKFECTSATTFLGLLKDGGEKMTPEEEKEHLHNYIEFNLTRYIRPNDEKVGEEEYHWMRHEHFPDELKVGYLNFKANCIAETRKFKSVNDYESELPENKLGIIGLEVRVVIPKFRLSGTFDAMFLMKFKGKNLIFIYDWKTNKKKEGEQFDHSRWKYPPPLNYFTKDHLTEYTLQVWVYRYILEEEYGIPIDGARVVWFHESLPNRYKIWKPKFEYDKDFIENVLGFNLEWNYGN